MGRSEHEDVRFLGIKISNLNYKEMREKIVDNTSRGAYVCVTDVGNVIRATKDRKFYKAINDSLISVPDGMPLAWYGKLVGCRKINRVSGMQLLMRLLEEENGLKHFLLGDTEETIRKVKEKAQKANEKIRISGFSPPFKESFDEFDNRTIFSKIDRESPDVIWVSLGGGKQDKWMHENIHRLKKGVMIGVGAAFRFYIGEIKTPPNIFQSLGLQWFFRMVQNPRILRNQLQTFPKFIINFPFEVTRARKAVTNENKSPI